MAIVEVGHGDVIEAIRRFDEDLAAHPQSFNWQTNRSYKYGLVHEGRMYPLKKIISLATGEEVNEFSGGPEAIGYLTKLGFEVAPLQMPVENEVKAALHDLLLGYYPKTVQPKDAYDLLAERFGLSQSQRTLPMPKSGEIHWENRVRQARRKLVDEGVVDKSLHGVWQLRVRTASRVWVEKCLVEGRPDRLEGEHALGVALWSPVRASDGRDIYKNMRLVQPGDPVLHLTDNSQIAGVSVAAEFASPEFVGLEGTSWAGQPSYRIALRDYQPLNPPLERREFLEAAEPRLELQHILERHNGLFYTRDLDLNQGFYLTEAPQALVALFDKLYRDKTGRSLPHIAVGRGRLDLSASCLSAAIKLFQWICGGQGFSSERYRREERDYKEAISKAWRQAATRERLDAAVTGEMPAEQLADELGRLLASNNLLPWRYAGFVKGPWSQERAVAFVRSIRELLFDGDDSSPNVSRFNEAMGTYYAQHVGFDATKPASHCIPSLMLWLSDPSKQFFLRPDLYNQATRALLGDVAEGQGNIMSTAYYAAALRFAESLFDDLVAAGLAPADMIDVQGFLWVVFSRNRIWFVRTAKIVEVPAPSPDKGGHLLAFDFARRADLARYFEALSSLSGKERDARRAELEKLEDDVDERRALASLHDLAGRSESLVVVCDVRFDQLAQRSLMRVRGLSLTRAGYSYSDARGHELPIELLAEPDQGVAPPGSLFAKLNAPIAALTLGEALDAIAEDTDLPEEDREILPDHLPEIMPPAPLERVPYTMRDALEGLFMRPEEFEAARAAWRAKRNLILQGPPGVGKTFVAQRLAYALMGYRDRGRVQMVQFHQSYSYEDFVQGYRPAPKGSFVLKTGPFFEFCKRALVDQAETHVFIIDEVNRGNLSRIFGELLMLIEHDKRSPDWGVRLTYQEGTEDRFFVPPNVYLLGMMNTADRSLAVVDYALRRRFAFVTLRPAFEEEAFGRHLEARGVSNAMIVKIREAMGELNGAIASDKTNLGPGFCIGHSFFVSLPDPPAAAFGPDAPDVDEEAWYWRIVSTEVKPLLEEYWFDAPQKAEGWIRKLLG